MEETAAARKGYELMGISAGFLEAVEDAVDVFLEDAFTVVADEGPEALQAWADRVHRESPYLGTDAPTGFRHDVERYHLAYQTAFRAVLAYLNVSGFEPTPSDLAWVILLDRYREPQPRTDVDMVRAVFRGGR